MNAPTRVETTTPPVLGAPVLAHLRCVAEEAGVLRLSVARLDDPRLREAARAFDRFLEEGRHGQMAFLERTRDARHQVDRVLPGAQTALVGVVPYGGTRDPVARYAQWEDYHTVLHRRLARVEAALKKRVPGVATRVCVDTKPVMERALAALAGVGKLGKNGMLIVPGLGSYVVIGVVLTTARASWVPLPGAGERAGGIFSICGRCTACLDACPTDAFAGPGILDARRCVAYLTIEHRGSIDPDLASRMGPRVAGCDACQEVCPHNAGPRDDGRVPEGAFLPAPEGGPRRVGDRQGLLLLAGVGSAAYRRFVRGTALRRIPRRAMQRNARLALDGLEHGAAGRPEVGASSREPGPRVRRPGGTPSKRGGGAGR